MEVDYYVFVDKYFDYKSEILGPKYNTFDICLDVLFDYLDGIRSY